MAAALITVIDPCARKAFVTGPAPCQRLKRTKEEHS